MAKREDETMRDEHYDLISVLYHALQGDETVGQYIEDAENADDQDLAEHFRDVQEKYREIAQQTKEILKDRLLSAESEEEDEEEDE
jgi:hypothetical protein